MPAFSIQDFKAGMDLRKSYVTAPAGSLRLLRNAFVTAGAEIEKRSAFVPWRTAPVGSIGLIARNGITYVVANGPSLLTAPTPTSPGILQFPWPSGVSIVDVADWDLFNGNFYIVLLGNDGKYYHYYAQNQVTDPMATSSSIRTYGSKMYGVDGRLLRFSAINDPTKWTPPESTTIAITGGAVNASQAYLTFDDIAVTAVPNVGSIIQVSGATPNGVNGSWPIVYADTNSVVYNVSGVTPTDPISAGGTISIPVVNDGSGYIDLSAQDADSTNLIGLEVYYGQMAVFSTLSTQFWSLNADPSQNKFVQLLRSTGLLAANGLTQFGNGDVLYLGPHGIRSLRVQNISLTAGTTDVGTPIDEAINSLLIANDPTWFAHARCLIQPRTGRLFVVLQDRIYVLSTFQEPAITAWAVWDAPFNFTHAAVAEPYVMLRGSDNVIYQYGGDLLQTYDDTQAEVITPALACDSPARTKIFHGFDVGAEGTWTLSVGCDPNNEDTEEDVATFTGATYMNPTMTMPEQSTHISLRLRTTDPTRARLGNVMIIFDDGSQD